jgi:hypothetical protein
MGQDKRGSDWETKKIDGKTILWSACPFLPLYNHPLYEGEGRATLIPYQDNHFFSLLVVTLFVVNKSLQLSTLWSNLSLLITFIFYLNTQSSTKIISIKIVIVFTMSRLVLKKKALTSDTFGLCVFTLRHLKKDPSQLTWWFSSKINIKK